MKRKKRKSKFDYMYKSTKMILMYTNCWKPVDTDTLLILLVLLLSLQLDRPQLLHFRVGPHVGGFISRSCDNFSKLTHLTKSSV
jgi:hypothetical protein